MIGYVLIFLTLFSFIADFFIQSYQFQKISQLYHYEVYEKYVHTKRPDMLKGFNLRSLVQPNHKNHHALCEIFKKLILNTYKSSSVYYKGLEEEILALFQSRISFRQEEGDKHYIRSISDLNTLECPPKMQEAYLFLMRGSKVYEEDLGYPNLFNFLYLKDNKSRHEVFNLFDVPLEIIRAMFGQAAEEDLKRIRRLWANKTSREEEEQVLEGFLSRNRLQTHPYKDLISFKFRRPKRE